jgi:uncharacterized protein (DUF302 family)
MNFLDWMNMNMIMDMAFVVFTTAIIAKLRKLQNKITSLEEKMILNIKNPQAAKRLLKEQQQ